MILVTVVGQGLTLPALIRRLGVREDGAEEEAEELRRALTSPRAPRSSGSTSSRSRTGPATTRSSACAACTEFRQRRFKVRAGKLEDEDGIEERSLAYQRLMHELYAVQRRALVELRNEGAISNDVMRRIERELDLEESRLEI